MPVIPVSEFILHPGQPSNTWSTHIEETLTQDCEEWGINPIPPNATLINGPVPYREETLLAGADYTMTGDDHNVLIEFMGSGLGECVIPLNSTGLFVTGQETTFVSSTAFIISCPAGVTINNQTGPAQFTVTALPDGMVMKRIGVNKWHALGDASPR